MEKLKKVFITMILLFTHLIPVQAEELISDYNYSIEEYGIGYNITELGVSYYFEPHQERGYVIINDKEYSIETFNTYIRKQDNDGFIKPLTDYISELDELDKKVILTENNFAIGTRSNYPTTGYRPYKYIGYIKVLSNKIYISIAAGTIALLAKSWSIGSYAAKQFVQGIIDKWGQKEGYIYNKTWQSLHNKCPAVKEKIIPAVWFDNKYVDGTTTTIRYFWSQNPDGWGC